jgi:hypothetical protein
VWRDRGTTHNTQHCHHMRARLKGDRNLKIPKMKSQAANLHDPTPSSNKLAIQIHEFEISGQWSSPHNHVLKRRGCSTKPFPSSFESSKVFSNNAIKFSSSYLRVLEAKEIQKLWHVTRVVCCVCCASVTPHRARNIFATSCIASDNDSWYNLVSVVFFGVEFFDEVVISPRVA